MNKTASGYAPPQLEMLECSVENGIASSGVTTGAIAPPDNFYYPEEE